MRTTERLGSIAPLADLMLALARRRALSRALRWSAPLAFVSLGVALALARFAPHVPRALALVLLAPSLWPLVRAARLVDERPLELALAVDQRLDADASVLSAAELALNAATPSALTDRVREDARKALAGRRARDVLPPWTVPEQRVMAVVVAAVLLAVGAPIRARVVPVVSRAVRVQNPEAAQEARRVAEALESAALNDPDRAERLRAVADNARTLAERLEAGTARDTALTDLDAIDRQAEQALGWARDQQHRAAVDAALAELNDPATQALRDALARGDMRALDAAARALADSREASSRQSAQEALGRAAQAARRAGANDLASALEEEESLLRRRGQSSALARAVSEALGQSEASRRIAEHLGRSGDGESSRALDAAMREVAAGLTPEEIRRLAEAMARMATQGAQGESQAAMQQAGRAATQAEMRAAMNELVRQLRNGSLDRTRAGAAGEAGAQAQGAIGQVRLGLQRGNRPGSGNGPGMPGGPGGAPGGQPGGNGGSHDEGHVPSSGQTQAVHRPGFVAPAQGMTDPTHPGVPMGTDMVDTTGTRAHGPMDVQLRQAAPSAVRGVEHTPMPQPYRDQVRVYFNP